jgi:glycosyltransferase involved in cell wall biosynthesis
MRILHVAESAKGGVGSYLAELAPLQCSSIGSDNIHVVVPAEHVSQVASIPETCISTFSRSERSLTSMFNLVTAVKTAVRVHRPDVIHIHSTFAGLAVRAIYGWRPNRPRLVYCPHGWGFDVRAANWKRSAVVATEATLGIMCDRIVAVSRYEARRARAIGIRANKLDTVISGIGDKQPQPAAEWNDHRLKVLFVGRLDAQKGLDTLIDAAATLESRICVRVAGEAVAGRGTPHAGMKNMQYLGWLSAPQIESQLAAADVVVIPSRWEAFGLTALEAMRAGRMVIASNVGGLPEIVEDGSTGWLVKPDAPAALGKSLVQAGRIDRGRMGENGRQRFQALFGADRMHREVMNTYERCFAPEVRLQEAYV